jgi:hypothetical protein
MTTKTQKTPKTANANAKARKASVRTTLTAELRALKRVRQTLQKAHKSLMTQSEDVTGPTGDQIAAVLKNVGIGLEVTEAAITEKANAITATFLA